LKWEKTKFQDEGPIKLENRNETNFYLTEQRSQKLKNRQSVSSVNSEANYSSKSKASFSSVAEDKLPKLTLSNANHPAPTVPTSLFHKVSSANNSIRASKSIITSSSSRNLLSSNVNASSHDMRPAEDGTDSSEGSQKSPQAKVKKTTNSTLITPSAPSSTAANNKPILFNHNSRTTSGLDPIAEKDIEKTTINNNSSSILNSKLFDL
jgi:hypothetical protein